MKSSEDLPLFLRRFGALKRECCKIDFYTSSKTQFGYFLFGDIGYRYQRLNGFMFRVGVSPSFNFGDKYGLKKAAFFPYIGLGWSF